jgi:prophage antirepressor-like protein
MNALQPFTFATGQPVRTLLADGQPWIVAKDACDVLGIAKYRDAVAQLDTDERASMAVDTPGGQQSMTVVNEPGIYALMMISRSPRAREFRRWVLHEVLPALRLTGSYSTQAAAPLLPDMATPEGRVAVAKALLVAAEREVELTDRIAELEPKALAHDVFTAAADSDRLVAKVAKDLGWREKDLRAFLLDEKLIFRRQRVCGGFEYDFYAAFRPHFSSKETQVTHTWGPCNHYTLYVTPRGMELIHARIAKRKAEQQAAIDAAPVFAS